VSGLPDFGLYLVTDRAACRGRDLLEVVAAAVRGGVTMVQVREKDCDTREFVDLARALKKMLAPNGVPLIVNDRVDVALACGADGVHVGQKDMRPADVRRLVGPEMIVGLSVSSLEEALAAWAAPVDYLGIGPVLPTPTKPDHNPPLGFAGLAEVRRASDRPVVAIGGLQAGNAVQALGAGVDGLAVVSAVCSAPDPEAAARELAAVVAASRNRRS
jgi:thiamine-phosphate pyrophosphorylase